MSRSARAAGMVLGGVQGLSLNASEDELARFFATYASAGIRAFLFPGAFVRDLDCLRSLTSVARRATENAGLGRALIVIGGNDYPAFGLPFFPQIPTPLSLASSKSVAAAKRAGIFMGTRLAACGVDLVLGPRLDLASDPKDPGGALEGFGEDSRLAGLLGSAYVRGLSRAGVAACVGRFPGLGAICRDCYEGMAFIALPVERLERCEMRPFARAVSAGVAAVLVGRVLVPSLESERIPASSSARVIEGRLREEEGFRGLVIGDDIGAEDDPSKAVILGALAGCDLCLLSRPDQALAAASALEKAMAVGELPAIRVEMARRRLERLFRTQPVSRALRSLSSSPSKLRRVARDSERGVSLLRGSLTLEGAVRGDFHAVLIVVFLPPDGAPDFLESVPVLSALRSGIPGAEVLALPADPGTEHVEACIRMFSPQGRFAEAVILTYDAHFRPAQEGLAKLIEESLPIFRVIAMRDPYDAAFFPKALGIGATYGFSECGARTVVRILSGKMNTRGGRPVEVIGLEV
jgi:beta-N-acetylhexosaminidase